jgi:hypothetical protein
MSEFLPRTGPVASVVSATERGPAVVRLPAAEQEARKQTEAPKPKAPPSARRAAAAADYARIRADIADVLANIAPSHDASRATVEKADDALMALMPQPVIVLPLPPTDPHIVAFVAQVAQSLAEKAAQTRAAQANAAPEVVEAAAA